MAGAMTSSVGMVSTWHECAQGDGSQPKVYQSQGPLSSTINPATISGSQGCFEATVFEREKYAKLTAGHLAMYIAALRHFDLNM